VAIKKTQYVLSPHQEKQVGIIDDVERQIKDSSLGFSTVSPVEDYEKDTRICLTSVHLPTEELIREVQDSLIQPLRRISPGSFYYPPDSLHMTVKNVRVINDPPTFDENDVCRVKDIFASAIPHHKTFRAYFYRLLLFPGSLALVGTTDPELDDIFFDLDERLKLGGVPDDKKYANGRYVFMSMTLARFGNAPAEAFLQMVRELSQSISFKPYVVDSITLLTCNAVFKKLRKIDSWQLRR
jgi:hypothetical protein